MRLTLLNLIAAPMLPVLLLQGRQVRNNTPRLEPGIGATTGFIERRDPALRVLVLGDSVIAGVGVEEQREGLAAQIARALAERSGRSVAWHGIGRSGATTAEVHYQLLPTLTNLRYEAVIIATGVNDVTRLYTPLRYKRDLQAMIHDLWRWLDHRPTVIVSALPPVLDFPALPQPLRGILGRRTALMDDAARDLAERTIGVSYQPIPFPMGDESYFSSDGYHPSAKACATWARYIAGGIQV
jgi:lysophospholipase L1-like esterase